LKCQCSFPKLPARQQLALPQIRHTVELGTFACIPAPHRPMSAPPQPGGQRRCGLLRNHLELTSRQHRLGISRRSSPHGNPAGSAGYPLERAVRPALAASKILPGATITAHPQMPTVVLGSCSFVKTLPDSAACPPRFVGHTFRGGYNPVFPSPSRANYELANAGRSLSRRLLCREGDLSLADVILGRWPAGRA